MDHHDSSDQPPFAPVSVSAGPSLTDITPASEYSDLKDREYKNDPKYKKYAFALDKILTSFEVEDWHDIIPFLGKIYKIIVQHPQFPNVPKKAEIFKRLGQALNQNLPSGVHQKALDVYTVIFERIGSEKLLKRIPMFSYALFSFFEYATMSVKPVILNIYERFFIPLGKNLRICLKDFLLGILPALEEEGNEFFEKTIQLLDHLSELVGRDFFFTALWFCILSNSRHRLAAFHYLSRKTFSLKSEKDKNDFIGRQESHVVGALCVSLEDKKPLVVRHVLDLICSCFPLEEIPLKEEEDIIRLLKSVLSTLMKRDMSLTRRVYNWLIPSSKSGSSFMSIKVIRVFKQCIKSLLNDLDKTQNIQECIKPFKIIISLQDKTEIGQVIVNELMIDVVFALQKKFLSKYELFSDLMQYANMFIEMTDLFNVWKWIYGILRDNYLQEDENAVHSLSLLLFVLENFKIYDDDVVRYHVPFLSLTVLQLILNHFNNISISSLNVLLKIYSLLLDKIPDRIFGILNLESSSSTPLSPAMNSRRAYDPETDVLTFVESFYRDETSDLNSFRTSSIRGEFLIEESVLRIQQVQSMFLSKFILEEEHVGEKSSNVEYRSKRNGAYQIVISIYCKFLQLIPYKSTPNSVSNPVSAFDFKSTFPRWSEAFRLPQSSMLLSSSELDRADWLSYLIESCFKPIDFQLIQMSISFIVNLRKSHPLFRIEAVRRIPSFTLIIRKLWHLLHSKNSMIHLRLCVLMWDLYSVSASEELESVISSFLSVDSLSEREENFKKFSTFWTISDTIPCPSTALTQPLFLMTDAVSDPNPHIRRIAETWIRCCVRNYVRIVDPFIILLLSNLMKTNVLKRNVFGDNIEYSVFERHFNYSQVHFALSSLLALCRFGGKSLFHSLKEEYVQTPAIMNSVKSNCINVDSKGDITYSNLLLQLIYQFALTDPVDQPLNSSMELSSTSSSNFVEMIHNEGVELLIIFIMQESFLAFNDMLGIRDGVLKKLILTIQSNELEYQLRLLMLLQCIIALTNRPQAVRSSFSNVNRRSLSERLRINTMGKKKSSLEALSSPSIHSIPGFPDFKRIGNNPLFFKTIMCAFSTESNMILSDHWIDFSLSIVPFIMDPYRRLVMPLLFCLLDNINGTIAEIKQSFELQLSMSDIDGTAIVKMLDFSIYMSSIHRIFMYCLNQNDLYLSQMSENESSNGSFSSPNSPVQSRKISSFGLRIIPDFVRDVMNSSFTQDNVNVEAVDEDVFKILSSVIERFDSIWLLYDTYADKFTSQPVVDHISQQTITIRNYIQTSLMEMFEINSLVVIECLLETCSRRKKGENHYFEIFYIVMKSSMEYSVNLLLNIIRVKALLPIDKNFTLLFTNGLCTDNEVINCLIGVVAEYLMPHQIVDLWPAISLLVKDYMNNASQYKFSFINLTKLVHCISMVLSESGHEVLEERAKIGKDLMDTYTRLIDYCCLIACRNFEQGLFGSRKNNDYFGKAFEAEEKSIATSAGSLEELEFSISKAVTEGQSSNTQLKEDLLVLETLSFLVKSVAPNLKQIFVSDQDKLIIVVQSLYQNVVSTYLKLCTSSPLNSYFVRVFRAVLDILYHLSFIHLALKVWKKDIWDFFCDPKFLSSLREDNLTMWKKIIQTILLNENDKFLEILNKINFSTAPNLFVSKDVEEQNRSALMKKLSFLLLAGEPDQYVRYLPELEGKMMEFLRLSRFSTHGDVFCLMRSIFIRFKKESLNRFYATSFSIILRLLKNLTKPLDEIKQEDLKVYMEICKFVDLFLFLTYDETKVARWLFISDPKGLFAGNSAESPYFESEEGSDAEDNEMYDKGILTQIRRYWMKTLNLSQVELDYPLDTTLLISMKSISQITDLAPFFFSIENAVYQSVIKGSSINVEKVEHMYFLDLFQ